MRKKKKKNLNKKLLTLLFILFVVISAAYVLVDRDDKTARNVSNSNINFDPPTEEDKKRAEDNKQRIIDSENDPNQQDPSNTTIKSVQPIITYAGQYDNQIQVGAYVPNVFEDGGECTTELRQGNQTITKKVSAIKNVNSVDCPEMAVDSSQLQSKGQWTVIVSYLSASAKGSSTPTQVRVE